MPDILDIMRAKKLSPFEFDFNNMQIPPIHNYLLPQDIEMIRSTITSIRLAAKTDEKYKIIDKVMTSRNFAKFAGGTNRVVYKYLEDQNFVAKIALDKIGIEANRLEYMNQEYIKPYCAKTFYVTQCGTIAFSERLQPIISRMEFANAAREIYRILMLCIIGSYVADDIGTNYFLNYGTRVGFGICLVDYPYIFPLDPNLMYCTKVLSNGLICNGEIDYDKGLNVLRCNKCGKRYYAKDLMRKTSIVSTTRKKGVLTDMKINLMYGNKIIKSSIKSSDIIVRPQKSNKKRIDANCGLRVRLLRGDEIMYDSKATDEENKTESVQETVVEDIDTMTEVSSDTEETSEIKVEDTVVNESKFTDLGHDALKEESVDDEDEPSYEGYTRVYPPRTQQSKTVRDDNGRIITSRIKSSFIREEK